MIYVVQEYRNKQQKRQQALGLNSSICGATAQVTLPQTSPLGNTCNSPMHSTSQSHNSNSPMHATPQSPLLSPSPSIGAPSPHTQNSPMASPMTPSPGPGPVSLSQTSPRGSIGQGLHHIEDRAFSPNNDGTMRQATAGPAMGQNRVPLGLIRMGSHQGINSGAGLGMGMNVGNNTGQIISRGITVNMSMIPQQRSLAFLDSQGSMQRMRSMGPSEQLTYVLFSY